MSRRAFKLLALERRGEYRRLARNVKDDMPLDEYGAE